MPPLVPAAYQGRNVTLNLIPWNPVYSAASASMGFEAPSQNALDEFLSVLRGPEYGIFSTVRQEKGQDISGACGQLVIQSSGVAKVREGGGCPGGLRDIEELAG